MSVTMRLSKLAPATTKRSWPTAAVLSATSLKRLFGHVVSGRLRRSHASSMLFQAMRAKRLKRWADPKIKHPCYRLLPKSQCQDFRMLSKRAILRMRSMSRAPSRRPRSPTAPPATHNHPMTTQCTEDARWWVHMDPSGPIWIHIDPYGPIWTQRNVFVRRVIGAC